MNPEVIGKYIKELRQKNNLSQQDLSEKVHVTRQAISGWENGKNCPDSELLLALSSLFNVSINEIITGGSKESNIEEVTLNLVDDNIKKSSKIKRLVIIFTSVIVVLLISFLGYYFINNYNSIKVYRVAGKSDIFRVRDGMLITTRNELYIKLGQVYDPKNEKEIKEYRVYYVNNGKEFTIMKSEQVDGLYTYKDSYERNYHLSTNKIKNNLYLEITFDDNNKEVMHLNVKEQFNNKLNLINTQPVLKRINLNEYDIIENSKILDIVKNNNVEKEKEKEIIEEQVFNEIVQQTDSNNQEPYIEESNTIAEEDTINYEEIFNIIKEKGTFNNSVYELCIQKDDKNIIYSVFNNQINIDILYDNIIEMWNNTINTDSHFTYMRMEDFLPIEEITIDVDKMSEYENSKYLEMIDYLNMIYEY